MTDSLTALIERSDLDGLVVAVDRLCEARDWSGLVNLGERCRAALDRGRQLWPVASHIEYRLALEAPGPWAASVLLPGAGRFALGPLTEVAASTHQWADVAGHLPGGPLVSVFAYERVVRGEDLDGLDHAGGVSTHMVELPLSLQSWEPVYPAATYHPHKAEFASPLPATVLGGGDPNKCPASDAITAVYDPDSCEALLELAGAWTRQSNGRSEAVAVRGDALGAVAKLGIPRARFTPLTAADALALMAWVGASGGAHGRRRGMAAGRFSAWWALAALSGEIEDWPVDPDVLGEMAETLNWYAWDAGEPEMGWWCRLAIEDPEEGLAWAVAASDFDALP